MRIIGLSNDQVVFETVLPHGTDPYDLAAQQGYQVRRPCEAVRDNGDISLRLEVTAQEDQPQRCQHDQGRPAVHTDPGPMLADGETPVRRQRIAAYAVVRSARGLLATEFSDRTAVAGQWGLPGGGLDDGEQPTEAVVREIGEETQQLVELGRLITVQSAHWVGRAPTGVVEDFQAIRLVYAARCEQPTEPVVADVGGTTESARWVNLNDWATLNWTPGWRLILSEQLAGS